MADLRVKLLEEVLAGIPKDFYRDDGKRACYYCYVWFHGQTAINVGKGCDNRYLDFVLDESYNSDEARAYVRKYFKELECYFAVSDVTETASFAVEYHLIGHFKRRAEDGTLFNISRGQLRTPGGGIDLSHLGRAAHVAAIPSSLTPLANGKHVRVFKDQPPFAPSDTLTLMTDENPWGSNANTPGSRFFEVVMRQRPATVGDAIAISQQHDKGRAKEERIGGAQGHLRWLYTWGPFLMVNGQFWS